MCSRCPFFHNNDDYDELIFFSRDNIHPGTLTLHPRGFTHDLHPKAFAAGSKPIREVTDEVAVMTGRKTPWDILPDAHAVEQPGYVNSWKAR